MSGKRSVPRIESRRAGIPSALHPWPRQAFVCFVYFVVSRRPMFPANGCQTEKTNDQKTYSYCHPTAILLPPYPRPTQLLLGSCSRPTLQNRQKTAGFVMFWKMRNLSSRNTPTKRSER